MVAALMRGGASGEAEAFGPSSSLAPATTIAPSDAPSPAPAAHKTARSPSAKPSSATTYPASSSAAPPATTRATPSQPISVTATTYPVMSTTTASSAPATTVSIPSYCAYSFTLLNSMAAMGSMILTEPDPSVPGGRRFTAAGRAEMRIPANLAKYKADATIVTVALGRTTGLPPSMLPATTALHDAMARTLPLIQATTVDTFEQVFLQTAPTVGPISDAFSQSLQNACGGLSP